MQGDPKAATETQAQAQSSGDEEATTARGLLDQPIATGADFVEGLARSAYGFADDLAGDAPQLAGMVRRAATKAEDFSHDIRDKSVEELIEATQDFARRQPALFVGVAATAGFLLARFIKTGMDSSSPQPLSSTAARSSSTPSASPVQQSARTFHDA